ncbi:MAG TPA: sialidase family protein [Pirellulales bacterium]|nr:sialidase family protein [Pirellulales bacterium]
MKRIVVLVPWVLPLAPLCAAERVSLLRVPNGGIQPQVAVGADGTVHLIYFHGEPAHGDIDYVRSSATGGEFSAPLRVNRHGGSAIAMGNIRGAHLALGRDDRVHVAWMGSDRAEPKGPAGKSPMLYTRANDAGDGFEPERNVIGSHVGLDGGGSLAADREGHVYVAWHAPEVGEQGEDNRRVWVARSDDDGATFAAEQAAYDEPTGCCGCCGMRALADRRGNLYIFYRSAADVAHRDMYLLASSDRAEKFRGLKLAEWNVDQCVMSTAALTDTTAGVLAAWETEGQVYYGRIDSKTRKPGRPIAAPGGTGKRKHPVVAANERGEVLLAWTEGMGWNQGGSVAWQHYDAKGRPVAGTQGQASGVPVWSLPAVYARPDGGFVVLY